MYTYKIGFLKILVGFWQDYGVIGLFYNIILFLFLAIILWIDIAD